MKIHHSAMTIYIPTRIFRIACRGTVPVNVIHTLKREITKNKSVKNTTIEPVIKKVPNF